MNTTTTKSLNKRERRAQQLLRHYEVCESLGRLMGMKQPNGKRISAKLFRAEEAMNRCSVWYCNGEISLEEFDQAKENTREQVKLILGKLPDGFFINSDPLGYALKVDDMSPIREQLLAIGMHRDMGGYFILSPEITGE